MKQQQVNSLEADFQPEYRNDGKVVRAPDLTQAELQLHLLPLVHLMRLGPEQMKLLQNYPPLTLFGAPDFVVEPVSVSTLFALVNRKSL